MSTWKSIPNDIPEDTETVWVRRYPWPSPPFLATWDLASQTFADTVNDLVCPWYTIIRWRAQ